MGYYIEVTTSEFRSRFPAFADESKYSEDLVQMMLNTAMLYISPERNCLVRECVQIQMIYLMTAHLVELNYNLATGKSSGLGAGQVASASVGGVSVSKAIPNNRTELDYWLNLTPYGMQLLALLSMFTGIGFYIGGQRENVFRG